LNMSRRMCAMYLKLSSWIAEQVEIAAHYDVPLGVSLIIPFFVSLANGRTLARTLQYISQISTLRVA
jgi:hypothetical protein